MSLDQKLKNLLAIHQMEIDAAKQQQLLAYVKLLTKWNQVYNLTAVREPEAMLARHLIDSLSLMPYLKAKRILDVGTGAGLPGIPLSIVFPEKNFTLLDKAAKRCHFLHQVKAELKLTNVEIVQSRVEDFAASAFDCVTARAFASAGDIIEQTKRLLAPNGHWLLLKGALSEAELAAIKLPYQIYPQAPFEQQTRQIVEVKFS